MTYPSTLDNFTAKVDDVDDVMAQDVNELQTAVEAIETELGTDPAGTVTDVKTRLSTVVSGGGYLQFQAQTNLTISSGAVTVSRNIHTIDTEGAAATDNLDTINGGATGWFLMIRPLSSARTVVIRHNVGNIYCAGGENISLDEEYNLALGYYDGNLNKWIIGLLATSVGASPSASTSISPSASISISPSGSTSPSASQSPSASGSASNSPSLSPSPSTSPSSSQSPSASGSASISISPSASASPST